MDSQIKEYLAFALALIGAWPVFKGWISILWSWNSKRRLNSLCRERNLMIDLKNSDRALLVFSLTSILSITAMLGVTLLFHAIDVGSKTKSYITLIDWLIGTSIYLLSAFRLGQINRLKKYEITVKRLNAEILKIEIVAKATPTRKG